MKLHSRFVLILLSSLAPWTCLNKIEGAETSTPSSFEIGPVSSWVKPIKAPGDVEQGMDSTGTACMLVDRQENIGLNAFYYHEVRKITSESGVQSGASISIYFHPSFEKLIWHSIQLIRDGKVSNRLDRSRITLVPDETDPERAIYITSYTARIILDDVQVGDVIEFAWTTEGANPLLQGKYTGIYSMQWSFPIMRCVVRVLYPANRKLAFQPQNSGVQPTVVTKNGVSEMWYEAVNVQGRKIEEDVPDGYAPRWRLHISEFRDWEDSARWALSLFNIDVKASRELDAEVDKLRAIMDPEQRVIKALQLTQDQIRYIKVGSSLVAHPLTAPDEVFRRRFADDKDKALLLVSLLRKADVDAAPALVSESFYNGVRELLPSPQVFDHAIVLVRLGQNTYWIDPSRSLQRGPLWQIYVGRYGYALVLQPETKQLTAFEPPQASWPVKKVVENYRVSPPGKDTELEVVSEYRGLAADRTRSYFRENNREEVQKHFLQYYTRGFPEIKIQRLLWYEELPGENACRITESYIVPKIWKLSDDNDHYSLALDPGDISSAIGSTISLPRNDPTKMDYPNTVLQEMNVEMFEEWPLSAKGQSVSNDFFRLRDEPTATGSHIQLNFSYEALKDRVEVNEFSKFNEATSKAKDALGYRFTYRFPEQLAQSKSRAGFNWAVAAAALCFLVAASYIACRYFRESKLPSAVPPPIDTPARLNGIGGWLILLAIGQILRPISYVRTAYDLYGTMFVIDSWRSLTDPTETAYHPWWAPTLLFELFFNILTFVFCVLLIALFLKKRFAWPRAFAAVLVISILGMALDIFFVYHIPVATESISTSIRDIVISGAAAAIWIPYLYQSKRVKATFRY